MATKQQLLHMLRECIKSEEKAIPLYTQHLTSTLFLSGFRSDEQQKLKDILITLKTQSEAHRKTFSQLMTLVEESDQDVY